jgi:hypothetical protein
MRQSIHQLLTVLVRFAIVDGAVDQAIVILWGASTNSDCKESTLQSLRASIRHRSSGGRSRFEMRHSLPVEGKFDMSVRCDVPAECHVSATKEGFIC